MIIAYLHGYNSYFVETSDKVNALRKLGRVVGYDIDYNQRPQDTIDQAVQFCSSNIVDLVVGCSMGGWLASHVGSTLGIPFVALNPAMNPMFSLRKYLNVPEGEVDHGGYPMRSIPMDVVIEYPAIATDGCGLILLETMDNVFNYEVTKDVLDKYYKVVVTEGGSHRFESLEDQLNTIENFVELSGIIYGVDI